MLLLLYLLFFFYIVSILHCSLNAGHDDSEQFRVFELNGFAYSMEALAIGLLDEDARRAKPGNFPDECESSSYIPFTSISAL